MYKIVFIVSFLFVGNRLIYSINDIQLSQPGVRNFTKNMYKADNQNWSIAQGKEGTLYFANNEGLLTYNGVTWKIYPLPDKTIVRSVNVDSTGKIYIGSYEEFGYWKKDIFGEMHYTSLKPLLNDYEFHNEEIWKIISWKGITYFQSFSVIFAYDGNKIKVIEPPGIISCFALANEKLYLVISGNGLYELNDTSVSIIDHSDFFREKMIRVILPYDNNSLLVASSNDGIYVYDKYGKLTIWGNNYSDKYINSNINRGTISQSGLYVIGSILDGVFVFNKIGQVVFHINQQNGLQNNTVLSTIIDIDGYLWVGLDNGIDLVNLNNDIKFGNVGSWFLSYSCHSYFFIPLAFQVNLKRNVLAAIYSE